MARRGAASCTVLAAVRHSAPSVARSFSAPPSVAPHRRLLSAFANSSLCPLAATRPLAAMMGSPLTAGALARLKAHPAASARAFSQGAGNFQLTNLLRSTMEDCKKSETDRAGLVGAGRFQSTKFTQNILEDYKQLETDRVGLAGASNFQFQKQFDTDRVRLAGTRNFQFQKQFETGSVGLPGASNVMQNISNTYRHPPQRRMMDLVHISTRKNKAFVIVTDSKGNRKIGASGGCFAKRKGRSYSRYSAETTAEHVGRSARKLGLKSVIVKVKGTLFFKRKRKAILSWSSGFRDERVRDRSPIMYVHDVTQLPHNGCRLPKQRRT